MKSYYRLMLGRGSKFAQECLEGDFIGADFDIDQDLSDHLPGEWRIFNDKFIPIYLSQNPEKSKIAAGLACGFLYTICKGIVLGDVVLCPNGQGEYLVGEVASGYYYAADHDLPHRRKVNWLNTTIARDEMGDALRASAGSIGTVSNITKHALEIEKLIGEQTAPAIVATSAEIEDPSVFALEKHLEDFLVQNWKQMEMGKKYDIFEDEGELVGQQYPTDTGPIDILAVSKDKKELLVIELKKGRASDAVIGQTQRYMGYVQEELAESNQSVKGIIIALEDDLRLKRALSVTQNIEFYRYQVSFKLIRGKANKQYKKR